MVLFISCRIWDLCAKNPIILLGTYIFIYAFKITKICIMQQKNVFLQKYNSNVKNTKNVRIPIYNESKNLRNQNFMSRTQFYF